jgi:hypothetical protein
MTYELRLAIYRNLLAFAHASALADMRKIKSTVAAVNK